MDNGMVGQAGFPDPTLVLSAGSYPNFTSATYTPGGLIYKGVIATGNGADTTEDTLQTYTLPANSLSANGQMIRVRAWGLLANNADAKLLKFYFGSASFTILNLATANVPWRLEVLITRTGSSTQQGEYFTTLSTTSNGVSIIGPTQTDTNAIIIKITGQDTSTATANTVVCTAMFVEYLP